MKNTALIIALAGLAGCSSSRTKDNQPQPRIEESPSKTAPTSADKPAGTTAPQEEPASITIKKGEKRGPEATFKGEPPPGYVCFDFKNVDLEKVALPLFSKQAGVVVEYHGTPRRLTLGFNQPVPWRDGLGLVCQWTQTHAIRSQIGGRVELKDGYNDPAPFLARFDPKDKSAGDAGVGVLGADGKAAVDGSQSTQTIGGSATPSSQPQSSDPNGQIDTSDSPSRGTGAAEMDRLKGTVTPTNSGAR